MQLGTNCETDSKVSQSIYRNVDLKPRNNPKQNLIFKKLTGHIHLL